MLTIKSMFLGACYGFCTIMLLKGGLVKPLLLSQGLGAAAVLLSVRKIVIESNKVWFVLGFVAGAIVSWFLKLL